MKGLRVDVPAAVRPDAAVPVVRQLQGEWSLHLPFQTVAEIPNLNDREHWAVKARKAKAWRDAVHVLARAQRIPPCRRIRVELHYIPATVRTRDQDNLAYAIKYCCDGLMDAKVIPDDDETYVERTWPFIHPAQKTLPTRGSARFVLRVVAL